MSDEADQVADEIAAQALAAGWVDSAYETDQCPPCAAGDHQGCIDQRPHGWLTCWCPHQLGPQRLEAT